MTKPICAVIGVGPGNGAALARRFAAGGYTVALLARTTEFTGNLAAEIGDARAYACDVTDRASVERAFASIRQDLGEVDALIYNAGSGTWGTVEDISVDDFELSWRVNALGALVAAKQVIPAMKQKGGGKILFIGATASRRGGAKHLTSPSVHQAGVSTGPERSGNALAARKAKDPHENRPLQQHKTKLPSRHRPPRILFTRPAIRGARGQRAS